MENIAAEISASTQSLEKIIAGIKEDDIKNEQGWSVAEILEHLVIVDTGILRLITTDSREKTYKTELIGAESIHTWMNNDSIKVEAPDRIKPAGKFENMHQAMNKLKELREKIIETVKSNEIGLNEGHVFRHPIRGDMTKLDWLHFLTGHSDRHLRQIQKIIDSYNE